MEECTQFPFRCPNRSFGLEIGGHGDRVGNYRNAGSEPWRGRWSVQEFQNALWTPNESQCLLLEDHIHAHGTQRELQADTAADGLRYQLNIIRQGF